VNTDRNGPAAVTRNQCEARHPRLPHRRCERTAGHGNSDGDDPSEHWNQRADPALTWWDTTVLPTTTAQWFTIGAIGKLWDADQDAGCCPACCGPCHGLSVLLRHGTLDDVVGPQGRGYFWWDEAVVRWTGNSWRGRGG
jgi:hypothetical protein